MALPLAPRRDSLSKLSIRAGQSSLDAEEPATEASQRTPWPEPRSCSTDAKSLSVRMPRATVDERRNHTSDSEGAAMATVCQFCSSARLHIKVTGIGAGADRMHILTEYHCEACGKEWAEVTGKDRLSDDTTLRTGESALGEP